MDPSRNACGGIMRKIKLLIGRVLYLFASHLPESFFWLNIGQKQIRAFCGKLILEKCGKGVKLGIKISEDGTKSR